MIHFDHLLIGASLLTVAACGAYTDISRRAQVDTARVSQEVACQKHLKRFLDGADEGLSCEASKARAASENPLCNLSFSCPARDAGAEAGAE